MHFRKHSHRNVRFSPSVHRYYPIHLDWRVIATRP
nr:MAG TPA: hypothetical protein [Bacteriophage sp.]